MSDVPRICAQCGRLGTRQFRVANTGEGRTGEDYVCSNDRACRLRREKAEKLDDLDELLWCGCSAQHGYGAGSCPMHGHDPDLGRHR